MSGSQYLASFAPNKIVVEAENWPYTESTARTVWPVTTTEIATHVRIDDLTNQADYINTLIQSATRIFEKLTNIDVIQRSWITYRNNFTDVGMFELRKSKFNSLTSFQYLVNGVYTTIDPAIYYICLTDPAYAKIRLKPDQQWPSNVDYIEQAIKIIFTTGLATASANVPADIKTCLYHLCAWLYGNRGDNDIAGLASRGASFDESGLNTLPNHAREIIMEYRIEDFFGGFLINVV